MWINGRLKKRICFNSYGHDLAFSPSWEEFCKIWIKTWIMQNQKTAQKHSCIISPDILSSLCIHSVLSFSLAILIMHQKQFLKTFTKQRHYHIDIISFISCFMFLHLVWERFCPTARQFLCILHPVICFLVTFLCHSRKQQLKEDISGICCVLMQFGITCEAIGYEWWWVLMGMTSGLWLVTNG